MDLKNYAIPDRVFDEILTNTNRARPGLGQLVSFLKKNGIQNLNERKHNAELAIQTMGITFTVYTEGTNIDRE